MKKLYVVRLESVRIKHVRGLINQNGVRNFEYRMRVDSLIRAGRRAMTKLHRRGHGTLYPHFSTWGGSVSVYDGDRRVAMLSPMPELGFLHSGSTIWSDDSWITE